MKLITVLSKLFALVVTFAILSIINIICLINSIMLLFKDPAHPYPFMIQLVTTIVCSGLFIVITYRIGSKLIISNLYSTFAPQIKEALVKYIENNPKLEIIGNKFNIKEALKPFRDQFPDSAKLFLTKLIGLDNLPFYKYYVQAKRDGQSESSALQTGLQAVDLYVKNQLDTKRLVLLVIIVAIINIFSVFFL